MPLDAEGRERRARDAALARHHPDRRRASKARALERRIRDAISVEPALTLPQRAHLAAALLEAPGGETT